jgi:polysaccharide biosynthesis PFTS motif protein
MEGRIASQLEKEIFADFDKAKYRTIAFFDSSYLPNSFSPLEDGVIFYQSILKLLEEFPDIFVIIKEKKAEEAVLGIYEKWGGDCNIFHQQYKPALDKLRKHPRCHITGYKGDPSEIIAMSDLTITYAFSSSTVEALCARRKAAFFDPNNRWRGYRYDRIPNLVAHSYEELKRLIQKLLYETTEEEYRDFLNVYVKGVIDPYLDGKALTRFRKLLKE